MTEKRATKTPVLTPARDSRGNRKRNRCLQCGVTLKGKRPDARFCGHRCRQTAYRARHAEPDQGATLRHCAHCGGGYFANGKGSAARKYCTPSCRTQASRARRAATVEALAALGMGQGKAADLVETQGLPRLTQHLADIGFSYDQSGRCWRMPATLPVLVRT